MRGVGVGEVEVSLAGHVEVVHPLVFHSGGLDEIACVHGEGGVRCDLHGLFQGIRAVGGLVVDVGVPVGVLGVGVVDELHLVGVRVGSGEGACLGEPFGFGTDLEVVLLARLEPGGCALVSV